MCCFIDDDLLLLSLFICSGCGLLLLFLFLFLCFVLLLI